MAYFLMENFFVHPKFHPQIVMFILEIMLPLVEVEVVSAALVNILEPHH